jgi:RNA polymerase sigma factor (sigma-70 family)
MTDEIIMETVKNGDLKQASLLFDRYNKRIYNFLLRMTMDKMLAEDLTQNVFFRIIKYKSSYRSEMKFQAWIYQIARNVFSDHYQVKKNSMKKHIDIGQISETVQDENPETEQEERENILQRSLAQLTDEQRELLILTRFQHLKHEEVATLMDTTVANVKVKVHRAISKLREHYFELEKI